MTSPQVPEWPRSLFCLLLEEKAICFVCFCSRNRYFQVPPHELEVYLCTGDVAVSKTNMVPAPSEPYRRVLGIGYVGRGKEGNQESYKCNRLSSDSAKGIEEIEEDTVTRSGPFLSSGNNFRVV